MASLVPEPMEKCAVWAASPRITTLPRSPARQVSLRTVVKEIHRELLAITSWPSRMSAHSSRTRAIASSSFSPGAHCRSSVASNPAARQTSSCISRMKVEPVAS